jgi:Ser/Thr protein kinase RdoA (MazF antagonist)
MVARRRTDRPYAALSRRGQLGRLRLLARAALEQYPLDLRGASLTPLRHEQNATFRLDARAGRFMLRISRPNVHTTTRVASEMAWLAALGRDTNLLVPEPLPTRDGSLVVSIGAAGVPDERLCVVLGWVDGRFVDAGLTPAHLRRVGQLIATLHDHARSWSPSGAFQRHRVDTLTADGRRASVSAAGQTSSDGVCPTAEDGEGATQLVGDLLGSRASAVVDGALGVVRATTSALADRRDAFGLIHADLHQENVLHRDRTAGAIDFDDCGWGFQPYDLAVPLSELTARARYPELRAAILEGYAARRPLAADDELHIDALIVLRGLQLLLWILESRDHPAFRDDWRRRARDELDWIASRTAGVAAG